MIVCTDCGHRNGDRDSFCGSCGRFLEWTGEKVASPVAPEPAAVTPTAPRRNVLRRVLDAIVISDPPPEPASRNAPAAGAPGGGAPAPDDVVPAPVIAPPPPPPPPPPPAPAPPGPDDWAPPPPPGPDDWTPPAPVEEPTAGVAALVVPVAPVEEELPPQTEAPAAPVAERAAPTRKVRPGEKVCPECGEGNQPVRKFCGRCGHSLADAAVVRVPWWRRLFRRRGPKVLGAGRRPGNPAVTGVGKRVWRFVRRGFWVVVLVFTLLAGVYPPLRTTVVGWYDAVKNRVTSAAEQTFDPVRPVSVKASAEVKGHPGDAAVDQFTDTYWAAQWQRDRVPALTLDLGKPTTLVKLIVRSGAKNEYAAKHRPSIVVLSYSNEKSDTVVVRDTPEPQEFALPGGIGAKEVRVQILDVYPAEGATQVALTELELFAVG